MLPITIRQERGEQRRLVQKAGDVKGVCLRRHLREGRKEELWYNKRGEKVLSKCVRHGPPGRQTKEPQSK